MGFMVVGVFSFDYDRKVGFKTCAILLYSNPKLFIAEHLLAVLNIVHVASSMSLMIVRVFPFD